MTEPADPRHEEPIADDAPSASDYEALFRERARAPEAEPHVPWWRRLWRPVTRAAAPEVAPGPPVTSEPIAEARHVAATDVIPEPTVALEPIIEPEEVATPAVPVMPPPARKKKRKRAKDATLERAPTPELAAASEVAPTPEIAATPEFAPALELAAAPEVAPAPPAPAAPMPLASLEPAATPEAAAPEPFAIPEEPPAPEPTPEPERATPELREEDLPTGRPGPYYDPSSDVPVYTDEEIESQVGPPPRRRRVVATTVILAAALAAFGTGLFVFNNLVMPRFIHSTAEVTVPDLANLNYEQAELALKPLGLVASRAGERFDPAVPRGFILSQDPPPETPVRGRKRVMVVVSLGEEFSSVPSLFGESLRSARFLLQRSGLRVTGITRAPSDEVGEGLVAGTDPPAETVLPRNATVALLVSSGTAKEEYVMPDLLGREIASVRRHLESLGFRVLTPPAAPSVGAIVFQDPAAGSRISIDSPISLQATGRIIR